ncbi:histidine kinase [Glycomyces sp. TRM65418]|uniref:sensor histidine kinase n=1 Tax=Glycomyces sp. TRM65418 TaxID=2867006 RepID=UPI001CE6767A|nr:histidine kinase [Glycomyces sp. TRM65418]MCC3765596.1 histidine kinase [Glycomyces sp. TRM65418]QZD55197.1 hypothetical protein K3N28_21175 [Glycomyces sp. TRM65418]
MTGRLEATAAPTLGERVDDLLARLGAKKTLTRDAVLALAAALINFGMFWGLAYLVMSEPTVDLTVAEARAVTAIGCVQALLLCLRRLRPALCLAAVVACQVPVIVIAPDIMAHGLGPLIAAYTFAVRGSIRSTAAAVAAAVLTESVTAIVTSLAAANVDTFAAVSNHLTSSLLAYAVAAFVGLQVAARRRQRALEREQSAAAIRAHRERAEAAIRAERTRIARELHDVAAHHLSGMVIQAAAVERLIDRDAASAKSGVAWIRSEGKATLENLRQVVGLLRDGGEDGTAPVPGLSALPALVEESRDLEATFTCRGEPLPLPPIADISLYRIAQQSLTNARQHAPGAPVGVVLDYGEREIALEVSNGPARGAVADVGNGGSGLLGMRERADLVGAALDAGPTAEGGWRVLVRLPIRDADRPTDDHDQET